jgi:hypothetical protein
MSNRMMHTSTAIHNYNRSSRKSSRRRGKGHKHGHTLLWLISGIGICLAGSTLATTHFACLEFIPLFLLDGFAYFVHGVGAIPLLKCLEPIWAVICEL